MNIVKYILRTPHYSVRGQWFESITGYKNFLVCSSSGECESIHNIVYYRIYNSEAPFRVADIGSNPIQATVRASPMNNWECNPNRLSMAYHNSSGFVPVHQASRDEESMVYDTSYVIYGWELTALTGSNR